MNKYKKILVTGGAGFIGSHLVDGLIARGYQVRVLDNLYPQIHPTGQLPAYFNQEAEFTRGDVTDKADWLKALAGVDAVYHLAAAVGVGQSMYEVEHYVKVNSLGTALLLDILANQKHTVKKMIVAASMSSYGEGTYKCQDCGLVRPPLREEKKLKQGDYNVYCPNCAKVVVPVPTSEEAKQYCNSIYAINKKNQEEMMLNIGVAYRIPTAAMRYFNVYGTRQSLSNPYNGVVAIFLSRIRNGKPPVVNEDGLQTRDFIHIKDVTDANILALEKEAADYQIFNVGAGQPVTIRKIADLLINICKSPLRADITNKIRKLDVRHCYADTTKITTLLGWKPKIDLEDGLREVAEWSAGEKSEDKLDSALEELSKRGLR